MDQGEVDIVLAMAESTMRPGCSWVPLNALQAISPSARDQMEVCSGYISAPKTFTVKRLRGEFRSGTLSISGLNYPPLSVSHFCSVICPQVPSTEHVAEHYSAHRCKLHHSQGKSSNSSGIITDDSAPTILQGNLYHPEDGRDHHCSLITEASSHSLASTITVT